MAPTWPDKARTVRLVPAQTVAEPPTLPPILTGLTVIFTTEEVASTHPPLLTMALK